jgi:hypothetical protein
MEDPSNINELTLCMHDSFQTINNRIKKIELKVSEIKSRISHSNTRFKPKIYFNSQRPFKSILQDSET